MKFLAETGFLEHVDKGYFIPSSMPGRDAIDAVIPKSSDQELYDTIARERVQDKLPEQFSEAEYMRKYGVPRSQLIRVLNRLSLDGIVEASAGHGWRFLPTLNKELVYQDSYRFRMMIEPLGILEPTFRLDAAVLRKVRDDQMSLVASSTPQQFFEQNAAFHETLANFSHNSFVIEAVHRHSRLRRLSEQFSHDQARARTRVEEHVSIIDALLDNQREWAASLLRRHLDIASHIRTAFTD
jgi:DNA-binding GntR family transcriptional regulator